jgi:hypothetical protein
LHFDWRLSIVRVATAITYDLTRSYVLIAVQRGRRSEGLFRHDARPAAQIDAVRRRLHPGHRPHRQGFQTLAHHAGRKLVFIAKKADTFKRRTIFYFML